MSAEHIAQTVVFACSDCDEFELEKNYSGRAGTPGKEEFDRIQPPDECPVCGGKIERSDTAPEAEGSVDE